MELGRKPRVWALTPWTVGLGSVPWPPASHSRYQGPPRAPWNMAGGRSGWALPPPLSPAAKEAGGLSPHQGLPRLCSGVGLQTSCALGPHQKPIHLDAAGLVNSSGRQLCRRKQTASTPGEGRLRHEAGASWCGGRGRPAGSRGNRSTRPVSRWARDRAPLADPAGLGPLSWCCPRSRLHSREWQTTPPRVSLRLGHG